MTAQSFVLHWDNFTKKGSITCLICKRISISLEPHWPALHEKQAQEGRQ